MKKKLLLAVTFMLMTLLFCALLLLDTGAEYGTQYDWDTIDYHEVCGTDFGYNYLGGMAKGTGMQSFYRDIDAAVRRFHNDRGLSANEYFQITSLNFYQYGLVSKEAIAVYNTYKADNPLYYWLDTGVNFNNIELTIKTVADYSNGSARVAANQLFYSGIREFYSAADSGMDAYNAALAFHDIIIDAIDYAYDSEGNPEESLWAHSAYGVLTKRDAVCEGYARAYQLLLNMYGVENIFVVGNAGGVGHAWNLVRLDDGGWYWCDLTWDDDPDWMWGVLYNYFCVNDTQNVYWYDGGQSNGSADFISGHTADLPTGSGFYFQPALPERSATRYTDDTTLELREAFSVGDYSYAVAGYNVVQFIGYAGSGELTLPGSVTYDGNTYTVISIGAMDENGLFQNNVYMDNSGVTSYSIPATVRYIWDEALSGNDITAYTVAPDNRYYTSVDGVVFTKNRDILVAYPSASASVEYTMPDETAYVMQYAFNNCAYLTKLNLGAGVGTFGVYYYGYNYDALLYGGKPMAVNFEYGHAAYTQMMLAGDGIINVVPGNTRFKVADGMLMSYDMTVLYSVASNAFSEITIPASVTAVDSGLASCLYLERISVSGDSAKYSAFDGLLYNKNKTELYIVPYAVTGDIIIPDGVTVIPFGAFMWCYGLTGITLPDSVAAIENNAFRQCINLSELNLSKQLVSVGDGAFMDCRSLVSAVLPASLSSLGKDAFMGCSALARIIFLSDKATIGNADAIPAATVICAHNSSGAWAYAFINGRSFNVLPALGELSLYAVTLSLETDINANIYALDSMLAGFDSYYLKVVFNGEEHIIQGVSGVERWNLQCTYFIFEGIAAKEIGDNMALTLCGVWNGETFTGKRVEYSVKKYCMNQLASTEQTDTFKTLCADILNYGAAAQLLFNYNTSALANADMTDGHRALATATVPVMESCTGYTTAMDAPQVSFKAVTLLLENAVNINYYFSTAANLQSISFKVFKDFNGNGAEDDGEIAYIDGASYLFGSSMIEGTAYNTFTVSGISAKDMRTKVYVTAYSGGVAVSRTLCYSIESYAASKSADPNTAISALVTALMKYSDAAERYFSE